MTDIDSPFHRGKREVQSRLGVRDQVEDLGRRIIRDHLPDQHRKYRVARIELESSVITSFYLEPDDAEALGCHKAGQFLPLDDYDFYFCRPPPFMQSIYDGFRELNVIDDRIHYEFFGPGISSHEKQPKSTGGVSVVARDGLPVVVSFTRSSVTATWEPSRGTLLDLAEALVLDL